MNNNYNLLNHKLNEICEKGFIKMDSDKYINSGLLLERELGIETNDFSVADIDGVEIKAVNIFSKYPITLFSCTCDGPDFFELNRLVEKFGVKDYMFKDVKVLSTKLYANKFTEWGKYLKMKLLVDRHNKKIFILIANKNGKVIEKRAYWNFETINSLLHRKLNKLCVVYFQKATNNNHIYCNFFKYNFYSFAGFDSFLSELENGNIIVSLKYGVYRNGYKRGMPYNHGTSFSIKSNTLSNLFIKFTNFEQKK